MFHFLQGRFLREGRFLRAGIVALLIAVLGMSLASNPSNAAQAAHAPTVDNTIVRIKLRDAAISFNGTAFLGQGADELNAKLTQLGARQTQPLLSEDLRKSASEDARQLRESGKEVPDLDGYFRVALNNDDGARVAAQLRTLPQIAEAYVEPMPAASPSSPSFVSQQRYQLAAPTGIGVSAVNSWPGARGDDINIYDVEYSWNTAHEDLSKARVAGAKVPWRHPSDPFSDDNHGTAVLGILSGDSNAYGITGDVRNAAVHMTNTYSSDGGYNPAAAITVATNKAVAGDVMLLEQQAYGPSGDTDELVPIEWLPDVYDAIRAAVAKGVIVVEAAGNGNRNLNASAYGSSFPRGRANSGALVVGAGASCSGGSQIAHSRMWYSDYGSRVDVQGWGECVVSSGYGDLFGTTNSNYYTRTFGGTSSASAIVATAAAAYSGAYKKLNGVPATPAKVRADLIASGTPQTALSTYPGKIGPLPNLASALRKTDLRSPTVPGGLVVSFNAAHKPVLRWSASTDNVAVQSYLAFRGTSRMSTVASSTLTYTDNSAVRGATYTYKVFAVDAAGNASVASSAVTVTVP